MIKASVKELCELIWELEKKHNLYDLDVDGINPWLASRMVIYYDLAQKAGILEKPHADIPKGKRLNSFLNYIRNSVFRNPFFSRQSKSLIIPNPRTKVLGKERIDVYTHFLKQELIERGESVIEYEKPYQGDHTNTSNNIFYADFPMLISRLVSKLLPTKIDGNSLKKLKAVEKDIEDWLGADFDLAENLLSRAKYLRVSKYIHRLLLQKINPEIIYVVISYGNTDIIAAAKSLGIKVVEIQHGTFSKFHLGYSFPIKVKNTDYFPNEFWAWSYEWANLLPFENISAKVKIRKFDYLNHLKGSYSYLKKQSGSAVVISQGALTEEIAHFILNKWEHFKDLKITYKLHPGEYSNWKSSPSLNYLVSEGMVDLVTDVDLYQLFTISEYQIGVFSTAIFEGVEFNLKTILLDLTGIEYMDSFITSHKLKLKGGIYK